MPNDLAITLISSVGASGVLTAALVWLARTWMSERLQQSIKHEYEQKIESFKASVKSQYDVELEKLKSDLKVASIEHEVKFKRLHEKRADVVAETYALLRKMHRSLSEYVSILEPYGISPQAERRIVAVDDYNNFSKMFSMNIIFFPASIVDKLENIARLHRMTIIEFRNGVETSRELDSTDKWSELFERVKYEINTTLKDLEDEFRVLLGDTPALSKDNTQ